MLFCVWLLGSRHSDFRFGLVQSNVEPRFVQFILVEVVCDKASFRGGGPTRNKSGPAIPPANVVEFRPRKVCCQIRHRLLARWHGTSLQIGGSSGQEHPNAMDELKHSPGQFVASAPNDFRFLALKVMGTTAFGGPPVHISMFRARFVEKPFS